MYIYVTLCIYVNVCEFRCGSICVHPFTHGIVYMFMFVCMHSVHIYMHMYVSVHITMSVCERCM